VVPVGTISLDDAEELPGGVLRTHHAPGDDLQGVNWDRWAGVSDDGYLLRIRNVWETDTTTFGLVDPATGRTEWLPEAGYDFGDPGPLRLGIDELVFLDNRSGTGAVAVYDRVARRWSSYARFGAFDRTGDRMYQLNPITRASVDGEDRLWIKLYDAPGDSDAGECTSDDDDIDFTCFERWWSVPFREGGRAERVDAYDGSSLVWDGDTGVAASADGLTIRMPDGEVTAPLAAREACDLRETPAIAYSASPVVVGTPCEHGSVSVVYADDGEPLFALPRGSQATGVAGEGYVGVVAGAGRKAELFLVHVESRRVYKIATGAHTTFTDIGAGYVLWQSPENDWLERDGSDYWVAELP
jgi:hypothetical protein